MSAERTIDRFRNYCLAFPESIELETWDHPTFRAGKKIFATIGERQGRPCCGMKSTVPQQQVLITDPRFYVPDYVGKHGWIGMYLDAEIEWDLIAELVEESYRHVALKRMVKALDATA